MDPLTAFANMVNAITAMITEIVKGQPPEVREKIWLWYLEDRERWRKLFKLD